MKTSIAIYTVLLFAATSVMGRYVPTPDHAMSMALNEDSIKWKMDHLNGGPNGIIAEFVPEGQSIKAWLEMVAQQITFTKEPLERHVEGWKKMIQNADPNVLIEEESKDESSITYSYRSDTFNEYSIRRFVKGKDGIYVLAYHVRLDRIEEERTSLWRGIIGKSKLIRNPQKG